MRRPDVGDLSTGNRLPGKPCFQGRDRKRNQGDHLRPIGRKALPGNGGRSLRQHGYHTETGGEGPFLSPEPQGMPFRREQPHFLLGLPESGLPGGPVFRVPSPPGKGDLPRMAAQGGGAHRQEGEETSAFPPQGDQDGSPPTLSGDSARPGFVGPQGVLSQGMGGNTKGLQGQRSFTRPW